jgi:hypothetical protein
VRKLERDARSCICHDGPTQADWQLVEVLMSQRVPDTKAASLGQSVT